MIKHGLILCALLLASPLGSSQSRQPSGGRPTTAQLTVRVSFDDTSPPPSMPIRIQLLASSGATMFEAYTRDAGQAEFAGLSAGNYSLKLSSPDIEETATSFSIYPHESVHTEFVQVRRKPSASQNSSKEGSVSAAALNIPEKVRKEFEKGMHALNENKLGDAEKHLSKAVEDYPHFAAAWNARGVVAMRSDRPADARNLFQKAIDADNQFPQAYVNLARLLIAEKKNADAETLLTRSISLDPRDPNALTLLANLDLSMGKLDEAIANARKVHSLPHADQPVAHLIAGMALEQQHLDSEAAVEFRQFLLESPHSTSVDRIRAELEAIEKRSH